MPRLIGHEKPWFLVDTLTRASTVAKTQVLARTSTGGTVTFTVGTDGPTATVAATSGGFTAAAVLAALLALGSVDTGDIAVTGSAGGPLTVTGDIATITVDNASATGGTVTVTQGPAADAGDEFVVPIADLSEANDITEAIYAFNGWSFGAGDVDVPDFGSKFPKTIPGLYEKATPSLDTYRNDDPASIDAQTEARLLEGDELFVIRFLDGPTPEVGSTVQVWPVQVKSANPDGDGGDAGTAKRQTNKVMFSVTDVPQLKVTVSA